MLDKNTKIWGSIELDCFWYHEETLPKRRVTWRMKNDYQPEQLWI
jgi:hypothetical protein